MTLEGLKVLIEETSLSHKDVNSFSFGNNYNIAESGYDKYPHVFLELPYLITYDFNKRKDTVQFALNVLLYSKVDDTTEDHFAISMAKNIGDSIIYKLKENSELNIENVQGLSLREFSDDNVSGIRYELTISFQNETSCDYTNSFN